MQKLYKYTIYFRPITNFKHGPNHTFLKDWDRFSKVYFDQAPNETQLIYYKYNFPYQTGYYSKYYNIIYNISKFIGVKVMYRDILISNIPIKGLYIIGEKHKVDIWLHIINHYFRVLLNYQNQLGNIKLNEQQKVKYKDKRIYSSVLVDKELSITNNHIEISLEKYPLNMGKSLELYILGQFKLDYKNYNQESNSYHHALSKKFYNRRMLI